MRGLIMRLAIGLMGLGPGLVFGCGEAQQVSSGSNSNWLLRCDSSEDCGGVSCLCGMCTVSCQGDEECSGSVLAQCTPATQSAAMTQCGGAAPTSNLCLAQCTPGSCEPGYFCLEGLCVDPRVPSSAFCADSLDQTDELTQREEEVLALLARARSAQEPHCGSATAQALSPLRVDGRLMCSARILALDLDATRASSLVDSEGRTTEARMELAGYDARLWGEAFGYGPSAEASLDAMLAATDSCELLFDPQFSEVGIGCADGVCVLSFGTRAE